MLYTVRVYDNYYLIALQGLDTDDIESCEFSEKLEPKLVKIWKNEWHVSDTKICLPSDSK